MDENESFTTENKPLKTHDDKDDEKSRREMVEQVHDGGQTEWWSMMVMERIGKGIEEEEGSEWNERRNFEFKSERNRGQSGEEHTRTN